MQLRFRALGALFLAAGCATPAPVVPVAKPRVSRAARPAAVASAAEGGATGEARGAATHTPAPSDAEPPPRPTATGISAAADPPEATNSDPPAAPAVSRADPFGDVGFKEVNEKDWLAGIRAKIAQREKVDPTDLRMSPGLLRAVFVLSSPVVAAVRPGKRVPQRRHEIVVVDNQGRRVASFRPVVARGSDEPPKDLRFLSEERLVYEVVTPAPAAAPATLKKPPALKVRSRSVAHATKARPTRATNRTAAPAVATLPPVPPRLFIIQPLAPRARPVRCQGFHFTFTHEHDHLAFVGGGQAGTSAFIAVDGAQVYPRRGRTMVAGAPVWSKDGRSLAFLELPAAHPPRLVLVAAPDDPKGDMTWDLPADATIDGASVFWAGTGKLIVRKTALRPIFSTSFVVER